MQTTMPPRAPLMLLDSAGLWFRAFYAIPDKIVAADGRPVNALRGFLDMTAQLVTTYKPERLIACLDLDWRPQFRVDLMPTYKTHRVAESVSSESAGIGDVASTAEEVPDTLSPQVDMILEVLAAFGIATAGADGMEADDVLGTLAAREKTHPVIVVSGDRDLLQVATDTRPGVQVLYIGNGLAKAQLFAPADVAAKYGVPPERAGEAYAELAILRGDPSDGLPGVAGIGEKTASKLLLQYRSLAAIRVEAAAAPSKIAARAANSIVAAADYLDVAWDVVWVRRDCDARVSGSDVLTPNAADPQRLAELARELRVESAVDRLTAAIAGVTN